MSSKEARRAMVQNHFIQWSCCPWDPEFYAGLFFPIKIVISSRTNNRENPVSFSFVFLLYRAYSRCCINPR